MSRRRFAAALALLAVAGVVVACGRKAPPEHPKPAEDADSKAGKQKG